MRMGEIHFGKVAIHTLAAYPPANLNRDEDGRPKTAIVGGTERLRVSSQARKRPWRLSDEFAALDLKLSCRTRQLGPTIRDRLIEGGASDSCAKAAAKTIATQFGKLKSDLTHEEIVAYGFEEWDAVMVLLDTLASEDREPTDDEVNAVARPTVSVDVAMFGRMRAAQPALNVDAAVAVSPMLSTHAISIEADNWTALDDLNPVGSGGMGEIEFASAVMYGYVCVDIDSLVTNLKGDAQAANDSVAALLKVIALVGPQAMPSRFAQDVLPDLFRVELGPAVYSHQSAFNDAVIGECLIADSIQRLRDHAAEANQTFELGLLTRELSPKLPLNVLIDGVVTSIFAEK